MIGAVVEDDFEVHHRIAGEIAARGRVLDSLFDGGNEVPGNGAAEDIVDELELGAARERFHLDLAIAELAMAAGLFLVAALHVGSAPNGFPIGDLGRLQDYFGVIALLHLGNRDFDVLLSRARYEEFFRLRVAKEAKHGIFFHELMDADAQLVFVGSALGLDSKRDGGLRQLDRRILNRRRLVAYCVAGQGVFELGHRTDVAGMNFGHRHSSLALHDRNMRELLLRAAGEVLYRSVVLHDPGVNLEIRNAPGKGIRDGLENVHRERFRVGDLARGRLAIGARATLHAPPLDRSGGIVHDEIHQLVGPDVAQARREQHGEQLVLADGIVQGGNQILFGNRAFVEEFFHQLVVAFGNQLDQLFVRLLGGAGQIGGYLTFLAFTASAELVSVSLHTH